MSLPYAPPCGLRPRLNSRRSPGDLQPTGGRAPATHPGHSPCRPLVAPTSNGDRRADSKLTGGRAPCHTPRPQPMPVARLMLVGSRVNQQSPVGLPRFSWALRLHATNRLHAWPVRPVMGPGRLVPCQPVFSRAWTMTRPHRLVPPLGYTLRRGFMPAASSPASCQTRPHHHDVGRIALARGGLQQGQDKSCARTICPPAWMG